MPDLKKTEKSKKRGGREGRKYVTVTGCAWKRRKPVVNKNGHGRYIKGTAMVSRKNTEDIEW